MASLLSKLWGFVTASIVDQFLWWKLGTVGLSLTSIIGTIQAWPIATLIPLFLLTGFVVFITAKYSPSSEPQKDRRRKIINEARELHSDLMKKVILTNTEPISKISMLSLLRDASPEWHAIKRYLPNGLMKDLGSLPENATHDDDVRLTAMWLRWLTLTVDALEVKWKLIEKD